MLPPMMSLRYIFAIMPATTLLVKNLALSSYATPYCIRSLGCLLSRVISIFVTLLTANAHGVVPGAVLYRATMIPIEAGGGRAEGR